MAEIAIPSKHAEALTCDVALVGAGIMSATLAAILSSLDPTLSLMVIERMPQAAEESSSPWNNAGTGHAGMAELNYSPEKADGSVDVSKAIAINEQFQVSRQLWASLVEAGVTSDPASFINPTAHMSFVTGEAGQRYMKTRYELLRASALFNSMRYSEDPAQIAAWAPLLMEGRDTSVPLACTWDPEGTDINFGALAKQYLSWVQRRGAVLEFNHQVVNLKQDDDGAWLLHIEPTSGGTTQIIRCRRLFIGAGGYALRLLQQSKVPEARGYALFPISGQFLTSNTPDVTSRHSAKVYGQAKVGAPPMSVPHLDARVIDGEKWVLFGPFAGQSVKFLKNGSALDAVRMLKSHNFMPMLQVAKDNFGLMSYLGQQIFMSRNKQLDELKEFYPLARMEDWHLTVAGMRAQVIKPKEGRGSLEFGTETIFAGNDTVAAVLGASPGASTAVPIMLGIVRRLFADRLDVWRPRLLEMIPTWGQDLSGNPALAQSTRQRTASVLKTVPPTD
ncbi:MAG: malate dehydrogenase (quinone) [Actinomycetia bacterium]|nr:malate dehydrogenase (quinone) [Actinomycetes bacterium]